MMQSLLIILPAEALHMHAGLAIADYFTSGSKDYHCFANPEYTVPPYPLVFQEAIVEFCVHDCGGPECSSIRSTWIPCLYPRGWRCQDMCKSAGNVDFANAQILFNQAGALLFNTNISHLDQESLLDVAVG